MNNKVAAFGQRRSGVYLLSEIYNPDDTSSSVQNINKVIPAIGSIVVDDTVGEHSTLYVVYSVDAVTHKSTLVPAKLTESAEMVGDDANTMRMLFFSHTPVTHYYVTQDQTRKTGVNYYIKSGGVYVLYTGDFVSGTTYYERKDMTELHIDGRLSVYTSLATSYTIYHSATSSTTASQCVCQYYLNDSDNLVESGTIPMDQVTIPVTNGVGEDIATTAYRPRVCYTDVAMVEGDKYLVDVYNADGGIISQFTLVGHDMSSLADINQARRAITSISVQCSQTDGDHFFIASNQTLDQLAFFLTIEYDRGDAAQIAIDNVNAFMYADISSISVGGSTQIVFKYYPSASESIGLTAESRNYTIGTTGRYISVTKTLTMVASAGALVGKIAPIIYYKNGFKIAPLVYFSNHTSTPVIAQDYGTSKAVDGFTPSSTSVQNVTLGYHVLTGTYVSHAYQNYSLKLNSASDASGVYYYFSDPNSTVYFGRSPRPRLVKTSTAKHYKFSIATATGGYSAKDMFLKHYYYNAAPPTPYSYSDPQQPTHFRIRKLVFTGNVATSTSIVSSEYNINDLFALPEVSREITTTEEIYTTYSANEYPNTIILEFLSRNLDLNDSYDIIYGVPIDVTTA